MAAPVVNHNGYEDLLAAVHLVDAVAQQPAPGPANPEAAQLHRVSNTVLGGGTIIAFFQRLKTSFELENNVAKIDDLSRRIGNCNSVEGLTQCMDTGAEQWNIEYFKKIFGVETKADIKQQLETVHANDLKQFQHTYQVALDQAKREIANTSMQYTVAGAFVVVIAQAIQLAIIWKDLKNADNVIDDTVTKARIQDHIQRLMNGLNSLDNVITDWRAMENDRQRERGLNKIQRELNRLSTLQREAFDLIRDTKVMVNSHITQLDKNQTTLIINGISNTGHMLLTGAQLLTSWSLLGAATKALSVAAVAMLGGVQIANVVTYSITSTKIAELRTKLDAYRLLDLALSRQNDRIIEIQDWVEEQNLFFDNN